MSESLLTKTELLSSVNGSLIGTDRNVFFSSVATDSRNVSSKTLFVPLIGEKQNGHIYIPSAIEKGASVIFVEQNEYLEKTELYEKLAEENSDVAFVKVLNNLCALQKAAESYVEKFPNLIKISITGSCGKTTTKELMASVCSRHFGKEHCVYTKGNLNSETGLPLSVFNITKEHKVAVFEMGMNRQNEIGEISAVLKSAYGIITNIGTAHIGILGSRENIAKEKRKSLDYIPQNGAVFIPAADDFADYCVQNVKGEVVKFGAEKENLLKLGITDVEDLGVLGTKFILHGIPVHLHLGGEYNFINALAVIACAQKLGIPAAEIRDGIEEVKSLSGRLEIKKLILKNGKSVLFLRDCYNANLDSMSASIEFCSKIKGAKKRIFVLGDMKELGSESEKIHRTIGKKLNSVDDAYVFFVGPEMKAAFEEFSRKSECEYFADNDESSFRKIADKITRFAQDDDVLLLKGSNSMSLEKIGDLFIQDGGSLVNESL